MNDKTKTYTLQYKGCEVINSTEKDSKKLRSGVVFLGGWRTSMSQPKAKIKELIFSPTGFRTDRDISFQWDEVKKIVVSDNKKTIGILSGKDNNMLLVTLPNKEDIMSLIRLFCSKEIDFGDHKYSSKF